MYHDVMGSHLRPRGKWAAAVLGLSSAALLLLAGYLLRDWAWEEYALWRLRKAEDRAARLEAAKSLSVHGHARSLPALARRYLALRQSDPEAKQSPGAGSTWVASGAPHGSEPWHMEVALWNIAYRDAAAAIPRFESLKESGDEQERRFAEQTLSLLAGASGDGRSSTGSPAAAASDPWVSVSGDYVDWSPAKGE
jgi:hypothetical protein